MRKAFTLVEMLVAVILLSLLIGISLFTFRMQLITINKIKKESIQSVIKYSQIVSVLESMKYYAVSRYDILNKEIPNSLHYYFQGDNKKVRFISTNPIFLDQDALIELECKNNKLLYREKSLFSTSVDYLRPDLYDFRNEYMLFDNLQKCSIHYTYISKYPLPVSVKVILQQDESKEPMIFYSNVKSNDIHLITQVEEAINAR